MREGSRTVAALIATAVMTLAASVTGAQTIAFENDAPGKPSTEFDFGLAGEGGPGRWEVVAD